MCNDSYDTRVDEEDDLFEEDELSEDEDDETIPLFQDMGESYYEEIYGLTYEDMFG